MSADVTTDASAYAELNDRGWVTYRGYVWERLPLDAQTTIVACLRQDNGTCKVVELSKLSTLDWRRAHKCRRIFQAYSPNTMISVDNLPWELHEIEDDSAYATAIKAFEQSALLTA